jgi:hypothetical protein
VAAGWSVELHVDPDHMDGNEASFLSQAYFSIERCDFGISLMASRVEQWDDNQRLLQRKKALGSNVSQLPPPHKSVTCTPSCPHTVGASSVK